MPLETVACLLNEGRRRLTRSGSATAALDTRLLLQQATGLRHEDIAAEPARETAEGDVFRRLLARRERHEPVSRIVGERDFFGRPFTLTPDVLDPRPDTETLVEAALAALPHAGRVLDLGTGSGAIIVTVLAERAETTGVATDLSAAALAVAEDNAARHGVIDRVRFVHGNWFDGVNGRFDLIVSNPPYIPLSNIAGLPPDVREFDPIRALDGGPDGLAAYRAIAAAAGARLNRGGRVLVEIGAGQESQVAALFEAGGLRLALANRDLGGHIRCLVFTER